MKVLFISDFILAKEQGAKQSTIAHYDTLKDIFGINNVDVVALNSRYKSADNNIKYLENERTKIQKLISIIERVPFLISREGVQAISGLCKKNNYSLVFIDHSIYGDIVKLIKERFHIPVVAYFHGIMQYQNIEYKKHAKTSILYFLPCGNMKRNETRTIKYADKCLILNDRDNENLFNYYGVKSDTMLPVYYPDTAKIEKKTAEKKFKLLFVGGYFWPNVHGITWFCENVMPELTEDIELSIVGNGMDQLREKLQTNHIHVMGRVDSLDNFYNDADVVVGPIFEGEGMKTKTCEALMYGKLYLGTEEALNGYTGLDQYRCDTKEEFIQRITELKNSHTNKYHQEMRDLYEEYYSPAMAKYTLMKLFSELKL